MIKKNKYYLIIENSRDLNLSIIKLRKKFCIIYRNNKSKENFNSLLKFREKCSCKSIDFFVANDLKLFKRLKADGLYVSAYNKDLSVRKFKFNRAKIIGSAHNLKEIKLKLLQGCSDIIFSRLYKTAYDYKQDFLGIVKFNLKIISYKLSLIPLGGINNKNFTNLRLVKSDSFVLFSAIKKKPAKIISRLF